MAATPKLRYVADSEPGIRRAADGDTFLYLDSRGRPVDERCRKRIQSLAIPPAWSEVWICRSPQGHLQATGRDAKGRKQYRYHPAWQESRSADKFLHLAEFGAALSRLRRTVESDLGLRGLPREKVLAAIVRLLDATAVRVGNEEYRKANGSFGLTTLRNRHANWEGGGLTLRFRGKSKVEHEASIRDPRVARVVRRCQELPGQRLFQYVDETGRRRAVGSADVNGYLRERAGIGGSAKNFRTWRGSVEALVALRELAPPESEREAEEQIRAVVDRVADLLGNTRAVCRKYYIHPELFAAYREGRLLAKLPKRPRPRRHLSADEQSLLAFLQA